MPDQNEQNIDLIEQLSPELISYSSEGVMDLGVPYYKEEESQNVYALPLPIIKNALKIGQEIADQEPPEPRETLRQVGPFLTTTSPISHREADNQAIDFLVPDGTPVLAADDGEIIGIVIENEGHGFDPSFKDKMNHIIIRHDNGETTWYCHVAKDSLADGLALGSKVKRGQPIAVTGMTGFTDRPHLHFLNTKAVDNPYGYKSLKPRFEKPSPEE